MIKGILIDVTQVQLVEIKQEIKQSETKLRSEIQDVNIKMNKRFAEIDNRFETVDLKFDEVFKRFNSIDKVLDDLVVTTTVDIPDMFSDHEKRIKRLEMLVHD